MSIDRQTATAFVDGYGRAWENWDVEGFVALFSDDVVYVDHPTDNTVLGSEALRHYVEKERAEQGSVSVRMGSPILAGNHVVAEFWVMRSSGEEEATLVGCFIAQLDPTHGRCHHFREYWFDTEGHTSAYEGWGE